MGTFSDRLNEAMQIRDLRAVDLVKTTGISKSRISQYVNGIYEAKQTALYQLAKALNVSEAWLMGYDVPMERMTDKRDFFDEMEKRGIDVRPVVRKKFPMLGNVACGEPIWAEEERDQYVEGDASVDADFTLIAKGDSMIHARIFDGDVLFVKKQPMVEDGEIAVVLVDNEATVKRVYYDRENNVITLVPENPTHKPMRFEGAKLDEITILGKVVAGQFKVM